MTVEEFKKLLDSYHKESKDFTDDERFEIGCAFRDTDRGGRGYKIPSTDSLTWGWLAVHVGYKNSSSEVSDSFKLGEHYRNWVLYKLNHDTISTRSLSGHNLKADSVEEFNNNIDDQVRKLYIQEKKVRDINNSYRRTLTDEARIEAFKNTVKDAANTLKNLPTITFDSVPLEIKGMGIDREAVLMLSDMHIGVECNNFYNKFNIDIARQRVKKLVTDTINYCHTFNVIRLNVVNLGDMILGLIHVDARIEQQTETVNQVIVASEIIANALNELQKAAPQIIYRSCTDNHSRVVADKTQHIEKDSFGKLTDWWLKERLKDTGVVFEDDNIDDSIGKFTLLNNKRVVFAHGHLDSPNSVFQNMVGATHEFIDYILLSHYHCEKEKSFQGMKVFVNGSIVGTEQYALSKRLFSKPAQTLLIFDKDDLVDVSIGLENA